MWGHVVATCSRWSSYKPHLLYPKMDKRIGGSHSQSNCNISSVSKYHTMTNTYGGWMWSSIHFQSCHQMNANDKIYTLATFSKERVPSAHRMAAWVDPTAIWMLYRGEKFLSCVAEYWFLSSNPQPKHHIIWTELYQCDVVSNFMHGVHHTLRTSSLVSANLALWVWWTLHTSSCHMASVFKCCLIAKLFCCRVSKDKWPASAHSKRWLVSPKF